jgi:hypothetical protein
VQLAFPGWIGPQSAFCAASRMPAASVTSAKFRTHGFDDGLDLARMDAPHAQEAELLARAAGIVAYDMTDR